MQNHGNLQAHGHRAHRAAICNAHRYAAATFAAIETDDGDEGLRSEEHTSELQSRLHLVCRLLLEKKKNALVEDRCVHAGATVHDIVTPPPEWSCRPART